MIRNVLLLGLDIAVSERDINITTILVGNYLVCIQDRGDSSNDY